MKDFEQRLKVALEKSSEPSFMSDLRKITGRKVSKTTVNKALTKILKSVTETPIYSITKTPNSISFKAQKSISKQVYDLFKKYGDEEAIQSYMHKGRGLIATSSGKIRIRVEYLTGDFVNVGVYYL